MATKRDYYEILGVNKTATDAEIKNAYRKLALKWHPDKHQGADKTTAEKTFKEINEAYQVLSDSQKKQAYDQFGHAAFDAASGMGSNPFSGGFRQGPFTWTYTSTSGNPFGEADFGDPFEIFESFFGGGFGAATRRRPRYSLSIEFMEALKGVTKEVEAEGKKHTVKIPAGVNDGTRIRFGEFDISINVRPHARYRREGQDLFIDHEISFSLASLGGLTEVETVDTTLKLKVRPGTASHTMIRLRGEGVPYMQQKGKGDLYVRLIVKVPENLNREQRTALEGLQEVGL